MTGSLLDRPHMRLDAEIGRTAETDLGCVKTPAVSRQTYVDSTGPADMSRFVDGVDRSQGASGGHVG